MIQPWVHRVTIKTIIYLQKNGGTRALADSVYECVGAWRYFEAIELWLTDNGGKAMEVAATVRTDKFTDTEKLLRIQARIINSYRQNDPFTDTCVAAHQQQRDWDKLVSGATDEQLVKIKARHEHYRLCQPELNPELANANA